MKKLGLIFFLALSALLLVACGSPKPLSAPSNLRVEGTTLKFDVVENAIRYRIKVIDEENKEKLYFVEQNTNLEELYMKPGKYTISIQSIGDKKYADSEYSTSIEYVQKDPYAVSELAGENLQDTTKINWLGRTYFQSLNGTMFFYMTASGFEVKFHGTELSAEFITSANPAGKEPHLVVFVDGETESTKGNLIVITSSKQTHVLVSGLEEGLHTVRVLKRSESIDSTTGVTKITTDGEFQNVDSLKVRKIEFIGASSSVGFGNLAPNTDTPKTTQNSDGLRAFPYLAATMVDAELNIFSASGWPLLLGPWGTNNNNIPTAYDYVNVYSNILWNHANYSPDLIMIDLGTNDMSYIKQLPAKDQPQAVENFILYYIEFIKKLNQLHPEAKILIVYGVNSESGIYKPTEDVYDRMQELHPEIDLHIVKLPTMNAADGIGSSNHPSSVTHIKASNALANTVNEIMGWEIVRENIK